MLGVQPVLGRAFTADDDRAGAEPVALISDVLWRRRFNADPGVAGTTMKVDGVAHTIVGVMPEGFRFPEFAQFWTPLAPRASSAEAERTIARRDRPAAAERRCRRRPRRRCGRSRRAPGRSACGRFTRR